MSFNTQGWSLLPTEQVPPDLWAAMGLAQYAPTWTVEGAGFYNTTDAPDGAEWHPGTPTLHVNPNAPRVYINDSTGERHYQAVDAAGNAIGGQYVATDQGWGEFIKDVGIVAAVAGGALALQPLVGVAPGGAGAGAAIGEGVGYGSGAMTGAASTVVDFSAAGASGGFSFGDVAMGDEFSTIDTGDLSSIGIDSGDVAGDLSSAGFDGGDLGGDFSGISVGDYVPPSVDPSALIPDLGSEAASSTGLSFSLGDVQSLIKTAAGAYSTWQTLGGKTPKLGVPTHSSAGSATPNKNGTVTTVNAQGRSTTTPMQPGTPYAFPDGTVVMNNGDGTYTVIGVDGTHTVQRYASGGLGALSGLTSNPTVLWAGLGLVALLALRHR